MPQISVKWGREKYELEVKHEDPPLVLKSKLFSLTNVAPERQKVMFKGRAILDDDNWETLKLTDGSQLMLMGSSAPIPEAPVIVDDVLDPDSIDIDLNKKVTRRGLYNFGNTCYINSVLQMLASVPELLKIVETSPSRDSFLIHLRSALMCTTPLSTRDLLGGSDFNRRMGNFNAALRVVHPTFAEMTRGQYDQQDANEALVTIVQTVSRISVLANSNIPTIGDYFRIDTVAEYTCLECDNEPPKRTNDTLLNATCHLQKSTHFLLSSLTATMDEEIELNSIKLQRQAKFRKKVTYERLPKYLAIHMLRYEYKEQKKVTAKIGKDVKFSTTFDAYDLCTEKLKEKLKPMREAAKAETDARLIRETKKKLATPAEAAKMVDDGVALPSEFEGDVGSNNSGLYELKAVITHRGQTPKSGHYVAWVKEGDDWMVCDDENVVFVQEKDVLATSGNVATCSHVTYLMLYESREIKKYPKLK